MNASPRAGKSGTPRRRLHPSVDGCGRIAEAVALRRVVQDHAAEYAVSLSRHESAVLDLCCRLCREAETNSSIGWQQIRRARELFERVQRQSAQAVTR